MNSNTRPRSQSGDDDEAIALDLFEQSMTSAERYPTNIVYTRNYDYQLEEYERQIWAHRSKLFGVQNIVDFLDFREDSEDRGPAAKCLRSKEDLTAAGVHCGSKQSDPLCRFIFLSAPGSRARLSVDHTLLTSILTWHQVMPEIVEFLLAFGISQRPKVFQHSGFRSEMNLDQDSNRLALRILGRSGREIRLCHILRTAERLDVAGRSPNSWPWILRPTVTYHSFDIESQRSLWLVIKANSVIKNRVRSTCNDQDLYRLSPTDDFNNTFESTLRTHLMLCAWASENWRWYISDVEEHVQNITQRALTEDLSMPELTGGDGRPKKEQDASFSFKHVQHIYYLEEKANEGLLVLRSNVAVIQELRDFYAEVVPLLESTPECIKTLGFAMTMFRRHLDNTVKDLVMQQARLQMLLQLLADRRALLERMRQWKNSQRAQLSATNMERMTEAMHTLAQQTRLEATNMRIITLVTLFFLPGTFVSTLMSTPILHYAEDHSIINRDALLLFLEISLPLLVITFVVWTALYWHKKRSEERERLAQSSQAVV